MLQFICCLYARQNKRVIHDLFKDIMRFSIITQQLLKRTVTENVFVRNNFILRHAILLFRPVAAPSFIIATCDSFRVIFFTQSESNSSLSLSDIEMEKSLSLSSSLDCSLFMLQHMPLAKLQGRSISICISVIDYISFFTFFLSDKPDASQ